MPLYSYDFAERFYSYFISEGLGTEIQIRNTESKQKCFDSGETIYFCVSSEIAMFKYIKTRGFLVCVSHREQYPSFSLWSIFQNI